MNQRVFHTLTDEQGKAKAFAWLVNHLHEKGMMSDDDLDTMLLDAINAQPD